MKSETEAHERMSAQEDADIAKMKMSVKGMAPQLTKILSLSGDVSDLQGQVKTKLQAFEEKVCIFCIFGCAVANDRLTYLTGQYQALKDKQNGLSDTSSAVSEGLSEAREKVGSLEQQDDSGAIMAGYKELKDELEPVRFWPIVHDGKPDW